MNAQAKNVIRVFSVEALRMFSFIVDDPYSRDMVDNITSLSIEHIVSAVISSVSTTSDPRN